MPRLHYMTRSGQNVGLKVPWNFGLAVIWCKTNSKLAASRILLCRR